MLKDIEEKKLNSDELLFKIGVAIGRFTEYMVGEAKGYEKVSLDEKLTPEEFKDYYYTTESLMSILTPYLNAVDVGDVKDKIKTFLKEAEAEESNRTLSRFQEIIWEALDELRTMLRVETNLEVNLEV